MVFNEWRDTLRDASLSKVRTLSVAPGCLGAKGTSLSESIVLLRLVLGTVQVAVEALGFSPAWGRRDRSALAGGTLLFAPLCHVLRYGAGSCVKRRTSSLGPCHMDQFLACWSGEGMGLVCLSFCHCGKSKIPACGLTRICTYYEKV